MSTLRTQLNYKLIDAEDMTSSFNSDLIKVNDIEGFSIDIRWYNGTTPVGAVKLQASNNHESDATITWTDINDSEKPVTGNNGSILYDFYPHSFSIVRVVYTSTSGVATMDAIANLRSRQN